MRIGVLDTETAGLFGELRLIGWQVDGRYQVSETIQDWYEVAMLEETGNGHVTWYAHNADFDAGYLLDLLPSFQSLDWSKTIFVNGRLLRLRTTEGLELRDSMALLPGSLDDVLTSWHTQTRKHHLDWQGLGYSSLEDYFTNVAIDDAEYRAYLKADVQGLSEVLHKLLALTGLDDLRLTTASTAMTMYERSDQEMYSLVTRCHWNRDKDDFLRSAYYGGRTEVFKPNLKGGYHYDVNSLYPSVMESEEYPLYYPEESENPDDALVMWRLFMKRDAYGRSEYPACIVRATVCVPDSQAACPPLPLRRDGRLLFPIGRFTGTWVGAELRNAVENGETTVLSVEKVFAWETVAPVFHDFIAGVKDGKLNSKGAKREFYKLIQNSLYGKFGQQAERENISLATDKLKNKLIDRGEPMTLYHTVYGHLCEYKVRRYSPFMQPQLSAHVTAYARVKMYQAIWSEIHNGNTIYYIDTDSLVTSLRLESPLVDAKEYGKFKLESDVYEGLYLAPKLYAEETIGLENLGSVIRAKGVDRRFRSELTFAWYERLYEGLQKGARSIVLYDGLPNRRKLRSSILKGISPSEARYDRKTLYFEQTKRKIDWGKNCSYPLVLHEE